MSIKRSLAAILRNLGDDDSWIKTKIDNVALAWKYSNLRDFYYKIYNFVGNLKLFLGLAWNWRSWDSNYTLDVFIALLRKNGDSCGSGYSVCADKTRKTAYTAAAYLDRAYINQYRDSSLKYLMKRYKTIINDRRMEHIYQMEKGMYDKLFRIAQDREIRVRDENKKIAWEYINKHFDTWWD